MPKLRVTLASLALAGCATGTTAPPSLAPRAAEAIDPRVPVLSSGDVRPVDPALAAQLGELVARARAGDAAFQPAAAEAERLAALAGSSQSDSWVVAQQALSVAVAARGATTRAMGDIDAIAARAIALRGGLAPADLAAIEAAAAEVGAIDRRQAARVDAIQSRLGA